MFAIGSYGPPLSRKPEKGSERIGSATAPSASRRQHLCQLSVAAAQSLGAGGFAGLSQYRAYLSSRLFCPIQEPFAGGVSWTASIRSA
jgi:hypothetical protein